MSYHHGDQFDLMCVILYVVTRRQADLLWKVKTGIVQRCVALAQLHSKTRNLHYLCIRVCCAMLFNQNQLNPAYVSQF